MSILIVEDNPVSAKIIEFNLKKAGYETTLAQSGKDALEYLQSNLEIQLIITDIMMAEMDGLELLHKLKDRPEWKDIPVIICSSLSDIDTVKKAVKAGCRHYILKPINKAHLLQKVSETFEHKTPILKEKFQVMSELGLDNASYKETLNSFIIQVDDTIELLKKQIEEGSVSDISKNLANLFEGSSLVGAERVKNVLHRIVGHVETTNASAANLEYPLLLRELKILAHALSPLRVSDTHASEKEDEATIPTKDNEQDMKQTPGKIGKPDE